MKASGSSGLGRMGTDEEGMDKGVAITIQPERVNTATASMIKDTWERS